MEKHTFQAEVNQVLRIVVDSLYSHREVFLRELISNASDALDKLSFRSLTEHGLVEDDEELHIELLANPDAGTLVIRDNGVGMSHDELVENLGTIARSGSRKLMETLAAEKKADVSLIGQFGVGFYSSFLVADRVTVTSRPPKADQGWQWQSEAKGEFTLEESEREARGTHVILHLKDDAKEFLEEWTLKNLVRKYSDYVRYPIRLQVTRSKEIEGEKDDEGKPKTETVKEWETINQASALWTRPKTEVTDDQYEEFYKHLSHDWEAPLARTHFKVEGTTEFTGLLFVPERAPVDLFERKQRGVRLFVKRVFIMEDCEDLLPEWLRFVRGVIDSEDLPLNVSREILQENRISRTIRKQVVQKTLAGVARRARGRRRDRGHDDRRRRRRDHRDAKPLSDVLVTVRARPQGGHALRPVSYKDEIAKPAALRVEPRSEEGPVSLFDYLGRMEPDQPGIYYITARLGRRRVVTARTLEALRKKRLRGPLHGRPGRRVGACRR